MNHGLEEATYKLALAAAGVWRLHPMTPLPPGAGPALQRPVFSQLLALVEEGSANSLVSGTDLWARSGPPATGGGATKRKTAPGASGAKGAGGWSRTGAGPEGETFKARLQLSGTPSGACGYTWRGLQCPRVNCTFTHDHVSSTTGAAPAV